MLKDQAQLLITNNRPGVSWIASVDRLIPLSATEFYFRFLKQYFHEDFQFITIAGFRSAIFAYHDPTDGF